MPTIFIFHGIYGHPGENWFPWMKEQLEEKGHRVIVPAFPSPEKPELDAWMNHMEQYKKDIDEHTIFIGHSLGAAFALRLMEHMDQHIHASFLVAPVWCVMGNEFDSLMTTFTVSPYDWERIKTHSDIFSVIQSDNDPYIRMPLAEELARHLDVRLEVVAEAGHFNEKAGYTSFPLLLENIRKISAA